MTLDSSPKLYTLYFDVTADLAHFRDVFAHGFFKTLLAPPRPTVLGMIGAVLGYSEEEVIDNLKDVYVGIKISSINGYAKEIVTMINQKSNGGRTPVMRTMLVKPMYRIAVGSTDEVLVRSIRDSLMNPVYPLYLGVSDCLAYIREVSDVIRTDQAYAKRISCIVPYDGRMYRTYVKDHSKMIFGPEIVRTVRSFTLTKKGKSPYEYINLLMFYNCEVEFDEHIVAYRIAGEPICMI